MEQLLKDGLKIIHNVDHPTAPHHRTLEYCDRGQAKLRQVGELIHQKHPNLTDMIEFAQKHIPEEYHGVINHAWSGIGDWMA